MTQPVNPEDVYKYINVPYSQKDRVKDLNKDAVAFDGVMKKWFIKSEFQNLEDDYQQWNPQFPPGVGKRKRDDYQVTPSKKPKIASVLSAAVLGNPHLRKLVRKIEVEYTTDEDKLYLSPEQVKEDLNYEVEPVFHVLKQAVEKIAMLEHFKGSTEEVCSKNLLAYLAEVVCSKQAEKLAALKSEGEDDDDDDVKVLKFKKNLDLLKKQKLALAKAKRSTRSADLSDDVEEEDRKLALQIENDDLRAKVAQMEQENKRISSQSVKEEEQSSVAHVALVSSSSSKSSSSTSNSSSSTSTSLTAGTSNSSSSSVPVIVPPPIKTVVVKLEKNQGNHDFVI